MSVPLFLHTPNDNAGKIKLAENRMLEGWSTLKFITKHTVNNNGTI